MGDCVDASIRSSDAQLFCDHSRNQCLWRKRRGEKGALHRAIQRKYNERQEKQDGLYKLTNLLDTPCFLQRCSSNPSVIQGTCSGRTTSSEQQEATLAESRIADHVRLSLHETVGQPRGRSRAERDGGCYSYFKVQY